MFKRIRAVLFPLAALAACSTSDPSDPTQTFPVVANGVAQAASIVDYDLTFVDGHQEVQATLRLTSGRELKVDARWDADYLAIKMTEPGFEYSYTLGPERYVFNYRSPAGVGGFAAEASGAEQIDESEAARSVDERLQWTTPTDAMVVGLEQIAALDGLGDLGDRLGDLRARTLSLRASDVGFPSPIDLVPAMFGAASGDGGMPSPSPSATATASPSPTASATPSPTASASPSPSPSPSATATVTPTPDPCEERHGLTDANGPAISATIASVATLTGSAARATAGATFRNNAPISAKGMTPASGAQWSDTSGRCIYIHNGQPSGNNYTGKSWSVYARVTPKSAVCDHPPGNESSVGPEIAFKVPGWADITITGCSASNPTGTSASAQISGDAWVCRHRDTGAVTGRGASGGWTCS